MLLNAPIVLFAGKGGVGKTTLATAWALHGAERGRRTLLVSTDPAHSIGDILSVKLGGEPVAVLETLDAVELDPEREAARYVGAVREHVAGITPPGMAPEVDRQLTLAQGTPGVSEAAVLERLAHLITEVGSRWDRVIVDTAPFGHTLRLLAMPATLGTWLESVLGRRRTLGALERMWRTVRGDPPGTDHIVEILERRRAAIDRLRTALGDPEQCATILVAVPEHLSLQETLRSHATLVAAGMRPAGLVLNRLRPERGARRAAFVEAFPNLHIAAVEELPDDVRDRAALRYIGARLEEAS